MSDQAPMVDRLPHRLLHLGHPESRVPGHELSDEATPPITPTGMALIAVAGVVVAFVGMSLHHWAGGAAPPTVAAGWMLPFALLLAAIATMPFIHLHWWEQNYARVAVVLGVIVTAYYLFGLQQSDARGTNLGPRAMAASAAEYVSFIYLIGSLFVVSGGILIRVRARASPFANTGLLLIGSILANVFGTTGASMLLIRPFLRMNRGHLRPYHVVFFIFAVSNAGGSLTPIGDPPLFLGYLQGVPFWWVLEHCWPMWLVVVGGLLGTFYVIDAINDRRTPDRDDNKGDDLGPAISLYGGANLLFIGVILGGILLHEPIITCSERGSTSRCRSASSR